MMYVVTIDQGYEGTRIVECDDMEEVLRVYGNNGNDVESVYEVIKTLFIQDLDNLKLERAKQKQEAIAVAKAKLTPDECKLLGIA